MAKFTKGHYETIAAAAKDNMGWIKKNTPLDMGDEYILEVFIDNLAYVFQKDNTAFDADRFKKACGF